jgi:hypothetical protein
MGMDREARDEARAIVQKNRVFGSRRGALALRLELALDELDAKDAEIERLRAKVQRVRSVLNDITEESKRDIYDPLGNAYDICREWLEDALRGEEQGDG